MLDELTSISVDLRMEKARKCLHVSEMLLSADEYADSANRSYYAIFHAMQAVLFITGFSAKTHSGSIAEFRKSFVKTGLFPSQYSDIVGDAFTVRNKSDYDIYYVVLKTEVAKQHENAKRFLAVLEEYIESQKREQQITDLETC